MQTNVPTSRRANFLTCYVALVIEGFIEHTRHRHGAGAILAGMRALECSGAKATGSCSTTAPT